LISYLQVTEKCGHPLASPADERSPRPPAPPARAARLLPAAKTDAKLSTKLEMLMRNLVSSKGFFANMPETICNSERYAAPSEEHCWNGVVMGRCVSMWSSLHDMNIDPRLISLSISSIDTTLVGLPMYKGCTRLLCRCRPCSVHSER
jgi:hypothetical protein